MSQDEIAREPEYIVRGRAPTGYSGTDQEIALKGLADAADMNWRFEVHIPSRDGLTVDIRRSVVPVAEMMALLKRSFTTMTTIKKPVAIPKLLTKMKIKKSAKPPHPETVSPRARSPPALEPLPQAKPAVALEPAPTRQEPIGPLVIVAKAFIIVGTETRALSKSGQVIGKCSPMMVFAWFCYDGVNRWLSPGARSAKPKDFAPFNRGNVDAKNWRNFYDLTLPKAEDTTRGVTESKVLHSIRLAILSIIRPPGVAVPESENLPHIKQNIRVLKIFGKYPAILGFFRLVGINCLRMMSESKHRSILFQFLGIDAQEHEFTDRFTNDELNTIQRGMMEPPTPAMIAQFAALFHYEEMSAERMALIERTRVANAEERKRKNEESKKRVVVLEEDEEEKEEENCYSSSAGEDSSAKRQRISDDDDDSAQ